MCGIAGIINISSDNDVEIELMLKKIEHRGDCIPVYQKLENTILGSVRLKIVDRPNGEQPFYNENNTIGVVFNGEIYNYKFLKTDLELKGHSFYSNCDTEILVHLYEEYGENFIEKLEGMFAFLIYDSLKDNFLGARDFFGVKPFFFCKRENTTYISSEMKSFLHLDVKVFEELKPGEYITNEGVFLYYNINKNKVLLDSFKTISSKVRALIECAVKKRIQTDLPIAVFLSGGIDSTIIHLLCCKYHTDVTALIIGEKDSEDVIIAKKYCENYKLKYHYIEIQKENLFQDISELIYSIETFEPNPVRGSLLSRKLCESTHELGFKIAICGEGSDEIFAGYADFLNISDDNEFRCKSFNLLSDLYRSQLLRIDRTGMMFSVEVREPFLDKELVEYVVRISPQLKVAINGRGKMTTKYILREAFKDLLPDYIYSREKMTLMNGAGIGSVERGNGVFFDYANKQLNDEEFNFIKIKFPEYNLCDKEEVYYFKLFNQYYNKAKFATKRIITATIEINRN